MRYSDPALVNELAAAYVLGTLGGGARRRFERLRQQRPDIALAVTQWEGRLGRLGTVVPPVKPPARVWQAIAARTRPAHAAAAAASRPAVPEAAVARPTRPGWVLSTLGAAAFASGAALAVALLMVAPGLLFSPGDVAMRMGEKLPPSYVGLLSDAQGQGKLLVSSLRHGRTLSIKVISPIAPPPPGRQLLLWAVPAAGAPFLLGTVPASGTAVSQLPNTSEKLLSKVSRLVVSEEGMTVPAAPSDTVVFSGTCAKLW